MRSIPKVALSTLLAVTITAGVPSALAFATTADEPMGEEPVAASVQTEAELEAQANVASGTFKNGQCTWSLDDAGTLRIDAVAGTSGDMGFDPSGNYYDYRDKVRSVIVGEGVTGITTAAFAEMTNLTSLSLPNSLTSLGTTDNGGGFLISRSKVSSVTIPANVSSVIGGYFQDGEANPIGFPFAAAGSLKNVTFADGMKRIPSAIFSGEIYSKQPGTDKTKPLSEFAKEYPTASYSWLHYQEWLENPLSLHSVTIPASVTFIEDYAFHECGSVKDIYFGGTKAQWEKVYIGQNNEGLQGATVHYAKQDEPAPTPTPDSTSEKTFPDVSPSDWFSKVVSRAAGLRLINGYKDGRFGPNDKVTRGQVAVILWNMAGKPEPTGTARAFPDVKVKMYYTDAIAWASSVGVVSGYSNGKFGPDDPVTREQLAAMLSNYAGKVVGKDASGSAEDYKSMKDASKVSFWATKSVGWCFRNKVISGTKDGRVNPQGNATRAETAKMTVFLHDLL